MAYKRKTRDRYDIETNYGDGWFVEDCEYKKREAMDRAKEYLENAKADVRIIKRREKIE